MKAFILSLLILSSISTTSISFAQSTWIQQLLPQDYSGAMVDVQFINSNTGWMSGGSLCKTTNGGINWIDMQVSGGKDVDFTNDTIGFLAGNFMIRKTTNAGINWTVCFTSESDNYLTSLHFYDSNTGWCSAKGIYKTINSGLSWTRYNIPGYEHYQLSSVSFGNLTTGFCTGYYVNPYSGEQSVIVCRSTNGGVNWQVIIERINTIFTDVQFLDQNTGYVNGDPPIKTTDGGNTWESILDSSGYYILAMFFLDKEQGWFGTSNSVVHTSDGGKSWVTQTLSAQSNVHGIFFLNDSIGWCAGMNNISKPRAFKTTAGGISFISSSNTLNPESIFLDQNYPNPFNPITHIRFELSKSSYVRLDIFDIRGAFVKTIVNGFRSRGIYEELFTAERLSSGIYFYRLISNGVIVSKTMILKK